jgi:hypothetical protein
MPLTPDQKTQAVTHLVANCDCWKGKADTLNGLPEDALVGIYNDQVRLAQATDVYDAVRDLTGNADLTVNAMPAAVGAMKKKAKPGCAEPDADDATTNTTPRTTAEWMEAAPVEIREAVTNALQITNAEKAKLVNTLVANVTDAALKARLTVNHMKKGLPELRDEVAALPIVDITKNASKFPALDHLAPLYLGAAGGSNGTGAPKKPEPIPVLNSIDWTAPVEKPAGVK